MALFSSFKAYVSLQIAPPVGPFEAPSLLYRVRSSPFKFFASYLYRFLLCLRGASIVRSPRSSRVRLVCISDTHTHTTDIPDGDVLIHAGDMCNAGTYAELQDQIDWIDSMPHPHKILVAGNHDSYLDPRSRRKADSGERINWGGSTYLQHSATVLEFKGKGNRRLQFYGAPQIPRCGDDNFAFQYERHEDAWSCTIPEGIDVLITHTPPRHHLDLPHGMGCDWLLKETWRVRPKIHVFGHVHAGYGRQTAWWDQCQRTYERICDKGDRGIIRDLCDSMMWMDCLKMLFFGSQGIIWSRLGGRDDGGSLMINAALSYRSTGRLGNPPQVIDI